MKTAIHSTRLGVRMALQVGSLSIENSMNATVTGEHCGMMNAVAALTKRARSARRANILVAIVSKMLLVRFTWQVFYCSQ